MNTNTIEKHFDQMGVRISIRRPETPKWVNRSPWMTFREPEDYSLDVQRDAKGERFILTVPSKIEEAISVDILQAVPRERHLLLMVRKPGEPIDRFLCGHDEREWFVAAVPGAVSTVNDAKESLKPARVRSAQASAKLDSKKRNQRKNKAFRRQGEWFFVPAKPPVTDEKFVLRNEPIARSGGKPHMVEMLLRTGGQEVYVCPQHPGPLLAGQYQKLISRNPKAKAWHWRKRQMNARVYAKGSIRHPDHRTIVLHGWHEVLMNTENQSRTMRNVAFLD
jgi:hypothetical protein